MPPPLPHPPPVCDVVYIYTNWADVTHLWPYPTGKTKRVEGLEKMKNTREKSNKEITKKRVEQVVLHLFLVSVIN